MFGDEVYLYKWPALHLMEFEIENAYAALMALSKNQEISLDDYRVEFTNSIDNDPFYNSLTEEEQGSYYHQMFEREFIIMDEILRWQRYSICTSAFFIFENKLLSMCKLIMGEFPSLEKLPTTEGRKDFNRFWKYLTEIFHLDSNKLEPLFSQLHAQLRLRHQISHEDGVISEKFIYLFKAIPGIRIINYGDDNILEIHDVEYLHKLIKSMEHFLISLLLEMDYRYKEIKVS